MFRLIISSVSSLSLLTSGFLLWQSGAVLGKLPRTLPGLMDAFFALFHAPMVMGVLFALVVLVVLGSWLITDLLLGFLYSIVAATVAFVCLVGILSHRFPEIELYLREFLR